MVIIMSDMKTIKKIIESSNQNTLFNVKDFVSLTNYDNCKIILNRLEKEGFIRRLIDGFYYRPVFSTLANQFVPVSSYAFVNKISEIYGWSVCVYGEAALNYLGLSTQVVSKYIFISDGPYREYNIDGVIIKFKHTNNKFIKNLSFKAATIVEAIRYLGKEHIDNKDILTIKKQISKGEKEELKFYKNKLPVWMHIIIEEVICDEKIVKKRLE